MKRIYITLICIVISIPLMSQAWISSNMLFSSSDITEIKSAATSDGGVVTFGIYSGTLETNSGLSFESLGFNDCFIVKFSSDGTIEWLKSLGSISNAFLNGGIAENSPGFIYVTGSFRDYIKYTPEDSIISTSVYDTFLAKYSLTGETIWFKNIGSGVKSQLSSSLILDQFGDLLVSGWFSDSIKMDDSFTLINSNTKPDTYYAKINASTGNVIWANQLAGITNFARTTATLSNNDYYIYNSFFLDSIQIGEDTIVSQNNSEDIVFFKTDLNGNIIWKRTISGANSEYSYSLSVDQNNNIYLAGYYNSASIIFQSNETESFTIDQNFGDYDLFIAKYDIDGNLIWAKNNGGIGEDRIYDLAFFDNEIHVSGFFSDAITWGGTTLTTAGAADQDMFYGNLALDGNYRGASSYGGRDNSVEEARALFQYGDNLLTVMRSNSDIMVLGDSTYLNPAETYAMYLGIIGCLEITGDATPTDVIGCNGDATGEIDFTADEGFGGPFSYSIDNGASYQEGNPNFDGLVAGEYVVLVQDSKNCVEEFGTITVAEPDELTITLVSQEDITPTTDGEIVVSAAGGTTPYTYTLEPTGTEQVDDGTFVLILGENGVYTVEVDDDENCGPVSTASITILSVDVANMTIREGKIYPNPSNGMITVEFNSDKPELALEVFSINGQRVMTRQVFSAGGQVSETFDMSTLAKGTYLIRVDGETLSSGVILK